MLSPGGSNIFHQAMYIQIMFNLGIIRRQFKNVRL